MAWNLLCLKNLYKHLNIWLMLEIYTTNDLNIWLMRDSTGQGPITSKRVYLQNVAT